MKNLIISCLIIVFYISCIEQKKEVKVELNEIAKLYLEDYNEFLDTLTTTHPALYEFISKENFDTKVLELKNQINNSTTKRDFLWKLNEAIALIGCGHTSLGFFNEEANLVKLEEYFPLQARLIDGRLYVYNSMINADRIEKEQEIVTINGVKVSDIIEEINKHIAGQAHITNAKKDMFNAFINTYIAYALHFPKKYIVKVKGVKEEIKLKSISEKPTFSPFFPKIYCPKKDFCLDEINKNTALLSFRTFAYYGEKTPIFNKFLDESFQEIKEKGYKNLILDVRGNLGGTNFVTEHLLKYTLYKPFQYYADKGTSFFQKGIQQPFNNSFKGKIIFLMNGDGFSSVGHLASIYKDRNRVIFVGEDLGSNQFCTANQKQFQLSNTKITYKVARSIFFTDVKEKNTSKIISPDYSVTQSITDYINNKDTALKFAVEFLNKKD